MALQDVVWETEPIAAWRIGAWVELELAWHLSVINAPCVRFPKTKSLSRSLSQFTKAASAVD